MILEILFSSLFATILYQIVRYFSNGQSSQHGDVLLPGHLRELGFLEFYYQSFFKEMDYLISSNVIISSEICMDDCKVRKALQVLAKRHPLLQAAITEVNRADGKHYYFTKMSSFRVDYRQSNKLATEPTHWHDVMTKDLLQPMNDQDGPLWRCCRLKECIASESNKITNCFAFTVHHAIIDGNSMKMLLAEFSSILHTLHSDQHLPEFSYDLPPSFESLLADKIRPEWWRRIVIKFLIIMFKMGLYSWKSKDIDAYFNKYPVIRNVFPDVQPENKVIFTSFSKSETQKLLHACKQHGSTLNGAITAAANMAMVDILQDGRVTKALRIPSKYAINSRRSNGISENQNTDYFGCYVASAKIDCYIPPYNSESFLDVFWKTTNDITENVYKTVKSEAYLQSNKNFECLSLSQYESVIHSLVWEHHEGRRGDSLFFMSNIGRFDDCSNDDYLFTVEKMFFATADHKEGFLFGIDVITVNDQLCCSFTYCPNVVADCQAEEFSSKFAKNLKRTFNES